MKLLGRGDRNSSLQQQEGDQNALQTATIGFAYFDGKKYCPMYSVKGALISRRERLLRFLTVKVEIDKERLLDLEVVKHCSIG